MKHNFAALYTCIIGASRVLGTVRNGSERFLAHGVCAYCWHVPTFSGFPVRRALLPKTWQEHGTSMTCRKQRVRKTSIPTGAHAPWPPESKCKGGKHVTCCGMIVCPQSAPPLACNMQDVRGPLVHFWDPFQNILNTASGVNGPQRGCKILQHVWAFMLFFWRAMFTGCSAMGQGSWRQHMLSPGLSYYITDTATGQISQYSFQIF